MALQTTMLQIDSVDLSPIVSAEEQTLSVQVFLSEILYPDGSVRFAEQGEVTGMLITTDAELSYPAEYLEPGVFEAQIPVENIEPDSYKILVNATLEGVLPVAASETVVMYPSFPPFLKQGMIFLISHAGDTMQKKVSFVTGAAGFIGSHVAQHCLNMGHTVIALDDLSGGFRDHVPENAIFIEGSITDNVLIEKIFEEYSIDYVYHLAAYAAEGLSHFIRRFNYTNNLIGSINLINASVKHDIDCFVFTSSIAVYGGLEPPMTEDMTPIPEDPYGIAKFAGEMDLRAAHEMFGLDSVIFRPHNVYGEHQNIGDRYRNVVGIFMNQILKGEPMTIFGDGEQSRAFSYIDDVAPSIARSVDVPEARNEIFNIGADRPHTVNHLAHVVAEAFGVTPDIKHLQARNEVVHAYSSHDKVMKIFQKDRVVSLEEGITNMAKWVKAKGPRKSQAFENVEIWKNMPPSWKEMTTK